jgi:hypothetical protein
MKFRAWVTCVCAFLWWGVFYPELCFPEDAYQVVDEADGTDSSGEMSYQDILKAAPDDTLIRSRFLEWIEECLNK